MRLTYAGEVYHLSFRYWTRKRRFYTEARITKAGPWTQNPVERKPGVLVAIGIAKCNPHDLEEGLVELGKDIKERGRRIALDRALKAQTPIQLFQERPVKEPIPREALSPYSRPFRQTVWKAYRDRAIEAEIRAQANQLVGVRHEPRRPEIRA
jgi:hypothetical protein